MNNVLECNEKTFLESGHQNKLVIPRKLGTIFIDYFRKRTTLSKGWTTKLNNIEVTRFEMLGLMQMKISTIILILF